MSLTDQINADLKEAQKNSNQEAVDVLRLLNAALKNQEISKRTKLSKLSGPGSGGSAINLEEDSRLAEDEIIEVISREAKKRKEAIESFGKAGRENRAMAEKREWDILMKYLPTPLTEKDLTVLIQETIQEMKAGGVQDLSRTMSILMPKVKGRIDGGLAVKLTREALEKLL